MRKCQELWAIGFIEHTGRKRSTGIRVSVEKRGARGGIA
jgi:hypothetical protein